MSGIDDGIVGQDKESAADVFNEVVEVAAGKVRTAYAALEEHITGEHAAVLRGVIDQAAGRVAGHMDGFERGITEPDEVSVVQVCAEGYRKFVQFDAKHTALLGGLLYPELIGWMAFRFQPELLQYEGGAERVVCVEVCAEQMLELQVVAENISLQSLFLFFIVAAGVDDDGFASFVGKHIAVYRKHVKFKSLDFHTVYVWVCYLLDVRGTKTTFLVSK